jgi:nucleoside-diphosphate-sugar epimerase
MRKLIVGCGYLGLRVASRWLTAGHEVYATTRSPERAGALARLELRPIVCDVVSPATLRALPSVDTVLYCVGLDRAAGHSMRQVYVDGLAHFLSACPAPGHFLYISSSSVYGQVDGEEVDETAATVPVEEAGRILLDAEALLVQALPQGVRLRSTGIYGPDRVIRRQNVASGQPLVGDGGKWLNLIHVEDAAQAVTAADADAFRGQVFNISDDEPVRRADFYGLMAQLLGAPAPRFIPPGPGAPSTGHDQTNRRVVNRRMREALGVRLAYPSYRVGLPAAIAATAPA